MGFGTIDLFAVLTSGSCMLYMHALSFPPELEAWVYEHKTTVSAGGASLVATCLGFPLDRCVQSDMRLGCFEEIDDTAAFTVSSPASRPRTTTA